MTANNNQNQPAEAFDPEQFLWKDLKSHKGKPFKVGIHKDHPEAAKWLADNKESKADNGGSIAVDWPLGTNNYHWTTQAVQDIGIDRYKLYYAPGFIYDYVLAFVNTKGWGFTFWDKTGDWYYCSTWATGQHIILYNSDNPDIVSIDY